LFIAPMEACILFYSFAIHFFNFKTIKKIQCTAG
jgi:hypothetical protein